MMRPIFNEVAESCEKRGHRLELVLGRSGRLGLLRVRDGKTGAIRKAQVIENDDLEAAAKALR